MKLIKTSINDLYIIKPKLHLDSRGYFQESFNQKLFNKLVCNTDFVQDNESKSTKGVLRGLHFQKPPFNQAKLVRCTHGEVFDVVVDLRKNSLTYGKHESLRLSEKNKLQLFIPRGFAHAFLVLSETAVFSYKVDNYYSASSDSGIIWNDPTLDIDWPIPYSDIIISKKDKSLLKFSEFKSPF
tara:strand:- start:84 stop:632 length:549 start_codon:yes stop_codon:yes gene_type:complete